MQHIVINGKIFLADEGYLDEPLDTVYPVYDLDNDEPVMNVEAKTLQQIATAVPACHAHLYAKTIKRSIQVAIEHIDIRPILRLMVNNDRYIHYVCGPVLVSDLYGREGGQYLSCDIDEKGGVTVFVGNTMLDLLQCERYHISLCKNGAVNLIKDAYFQDALELLISMTKAKNACQEQVIVGKWKDPNRTPAPDEQPHDRHCQWCIAAGLDGSHTTY